MDAIDSRFESSLGRSEPSLQARKEIATYRHAQEQSGEESSRELVTEKNVTEVSFSFLGLDFRRTTSAEKHYTKAASRNASQKTETSSGSDTACLEATILPDPAGPALRVNVGRVLRAYLPEEPAHPTQHFLA